MAPTKTEIETLCSHLGTSDPSPFFDRVSADVVWDVMGTLKPSYPYPTHPPSLPTILHPIPYDGKAPYALSTPMMTYSPLSTTAGDHPAAGHFTSLGPSVRSPISPFGKCESKTKQTAKQSRTEAWKQGALGTVNRVLREPLALKVVNVVGGGRDQDWALVELKADAVCKNGKYPINDTTGDLGRGLMNNALVGMPYPQRYAWVMRFDESGTIVQVGRLSLSLFLD